MNSNPLRILQTLDGCLHAPFTLHVYGRSALALGFVGAPAEYHATMDVDAILPAGDLQAVEANEDFWQAQEQTNRLLDGAGLYFTHLFEDRQIILTPDWLRKVVPIHDPKFRHLRLRRPSTADLILTKMMRIDPQDREDIRFLMGQADVTRAQLDAALAAAIVPMVDEIQQAFAENCRWLRSTWP